MSTYRVVETTGRRRYVVEFDGIPPECYPIQHRVLPRLPMFSEIGRARSERGVQRIIERHRRKVERAKGLQTWEVDA